jgi:hypothetical protein
VTKPQLVMCDNVQDLRGSFTLVFIMFVY